MSSDWVFFNFQNKVVISEMEPAMQTANRVIKKLKKAEKVIMS